MFYSAIVVMNTPSNFPLCWYHYTTPAMQPHMPPFHFWLHRYRGCRIGRFSRITIPETLSADRPHQSSNAFFLRNAFARDAVTVLVARRSVRNGGVD
jgi:hypothetical protein